MNDDLQTYEQFRREMIESSHEIPIPTVSEANSSEHWHKKSKRHKAQQLMLRLYFKDSLYKIDLPCEIKLIRLSPRLLDDDNLVSAFKWIRDEIADLVFGTPISYRDSIGRIKTQKGSSDRDPKIKWLYGQEKSQKRAIRVEIKSIALNF